MPLPVSRTPVLPGTHMDAWVQRTLRQSFDGMLRAELPDDLRLLVAQFTPKGC